MLKNIRLHVEEDNEKQVRIEKKAAELLAENHKQNLNAFQRFIPNLAGYLINIESQRLSIFCNKFGELNIVDYGLGRTVYGFHPQAEVNAQFQQIMSNCPYISFEENSDTSPKTKFHDNKSDNAKWKLEELNVYKYETSETPLISNECIVVLGCGLATHIESLIKEYQFKNIIVYEPNLEYFKCSGFVAPWKHIFDLAKKQGCQLFLQIGKDGRDFVSDLRELKSVINMKGCFVYKHYNHPIFDAIWESVLFRSWQDLLKQGIQFDTEESYLDYVPPWSAIVNIKEYASISSKDDKQFKKNLEVFRAFFPDVYKEFKDYTPAKWIPVRCPTGQINVIKKSTLAAMYSDIPKNDCSAHYNNFYRQPNKDGLIFGYNGIKLAHYIHYRYVKESEILLNQIEEEVGALPERIQSIIIFGLGVGYQLENLFNNHKLEKLFICEPNPDFFYASMFALDWVNILKEVNDGDGRIYINVGDAGNNLFRDLLNQFYTVGPYILSNSYFYQGYYNSSLTAAISQLREQLKIVISMGEFFDHAYYGIAHTTSSLRAEIPYLLKDPKSKISFDSKSTPVFLVGNGPSLDHSIETIKEWQSKAIIVSLGTSLQPMHRHGIVPDFHFEIEQNRATYDWSMLIGDQDYLKKVSLVSCNGMHPDTLELYKDCFLVFKEGESSTVSALGILGEDKYQTLEFAFPTVANLATNFFLALGSEEIYCIGIDLGFVDKKRHHSISSAYYDKDNKQRYDYEKYNNTSLTTPGNFRKTVNTKHEFKVAREIMEEMIGRFGKQTSIYNCSDGAKIAGTLPLPLENILITCTESMKKKAVAEIKEQCFGETGASTFESNFQKRFQQQALRNDVFEYEEIISKPVDSVQQAEAVIKKQRDLLNESYLNGKSAFFYYFFGSINYANAVKSKVLSSFSNEQSAVEAFNSSLETWRRYFSEMKNLVIKNPILLDSSNYNAFIREQLSFNEAARDKRLLVVSNSKAFVKSIEWVVEFLHLDIQFTHIKPAQIAHTATNSEDVNSWDIVIYQQNPLKTGADIYSSWAASGKYPITGKISTLYIDYNTDFERYPMSNATAVSFHIDSGDILSTNLCCNLVYQANIVLKASLSNYKCQLILPKYIINQDASNAAAAEQKIPFETHREAYAYLFTDHVAVYFDDESHWVHPKNIHNAFGTLGKYLHQSNNKITPPTMKVNAQKMDEIINNMKKGNKWLIDERYDYGNRQV